MLIRAFYELPPDLAADVDAYERDVSRFLAGEIRASVFKAGRVSRGVYEQRTDGTFMVRVRVAGGTLNHVQTRELAALSRDFGNSLLHVTTRQDVQFHDVALEQTPMVMRRLMTVGLTSKGGGGNTVRNVTACPYAGICPAERFDVTPCAHAVTEYLTALPGSYHLPRKYKIAFSGCAADCALAQVADLGFVAEIRDGNPGFRVLAGGGMGAQSRIADTLLEWSPATDMIRVAETVRRMFDQMGDRTNRHRARLRFVFDRLGATEFRRQFVERAAEAVHDAVPLWHSDPRLNPNVVDGGFQPPQPELRMGIRVIPQRQAGRVAVPLHAPLGFLPAGDLAQIGELAAQFSDEAGVRTTLAQNLLLRFVKESDLAALVDGLRRLKTDVLSPAPLDRFVACAGASTCRLGICLARHAARACGNALADSGVARDVLDAMQFHINGCSNACGQQPVGPIGLFGMAQRAGGRLVPSYVVTLGGRCGAEGARFGTRTGRLPAAALPAFVRDLAIHFASTRRPHESFAEFFDRLGVKHFEAITARHATVPDVREHPEFYRDLGAREDFSLGGRGAGECGAGVFEVIQEDLAAAKKAVEPFEMLLATARALLITRGVDALNPDTVLRGFEKHFIQTGLVAEEFRALLARARGYLQGWQSALDAAEASVVRLRDRVELLYSTLDANLEFHPPENLEPEADAPAGPADADAPETAASGEAIGELDLSGIACPMNFVKAKLKLEGMDPGDVLALVLDEGEPIRNVPASLKNEGQEVIGTADLGNGRWRAVVRKLK